ncbi:hypothetical protein DFH08DRAFT_812752 [Mycena albidolilacea]|uniref:Uncharacterized protein n=1 Tax=Mycena albidolilacea TaxID=1033008 RepID=A0AAD7EMZ5_9AGAR|nr:hypothetical protein DFH08DRAFT_812752 [Mycena albidolilacea]
MSDKFTSYLVTSVGKVKSRAGGGWVGVLCILEDLDEFRPGQPILVVARFSKYLNLNAKFGSVFGRNEQKIWELGILLLRTLKWARTHQAINTRQPNTHMHRLVPPPASLSLASPNLRPTMSLVTANGNLCPLCGNQLAVKVAAGGQMPGSKFPRCTNPHSTGQPYFHRFPTTSVPATTASSSPTMASPPSLANPPSSVTSVARRQTCPTPGCQSTRLNLGCSNSVCCKHCMKLGACALGAHKRERECKQQAANSSFLLPSNPLGIYRLHDEWTASTVPACQKLNDYQPLVDAARALHERELDQLPGVRSLTPEPKSVHEVYEREERELAHTLQLSLQDHQSSCAAVPGPFLRLPSSIVTAGTLQLLSNSPDFPTSLHPSIARLRSLSPSPGASSSLFPPPLLLATLPAPTARWSQVQATSNNQATQRRLDGDEHRFVARTVASADGDTTIDFLSEKAGVSRVETLYPSLLVQGT